MTEREYSNCPQCDYSAEPNKILGVERKHHSPHSYECDRCGYRTETKDTWDEARRAWNRARASAGTLLTAAEALLREIELVPAGRDYRPYYRLRNSSQLNDPDAAVIGLREAVEAAGGKTKVQRVRA